MALLNAKDFHPDIAENDGIFRVEQIQLDARSSAPSDSDLTEGRIYCNSSEHKVYAYLNGAWVDLTTAGAKLAVTTKSGAYTATAFDCVILVDASAAAVTISLPTASGNAGLTYVIKKIDSSGNNVTIDPNGTETIDGATTVTLSSQYSYRMIVSDGTNWVVVSAA